MTFDAAALEGGNLGGDVPEVPCRRGNEERDDSLSVQEWQN